MNKHEKYSIEKYNSLAHDYDKTLDGRLSAGYKAKILELCEVQDGTLVLDVDHVIRFLPVLARNGVARVWVGFHNA